MQKEQQKKDNIEKKLKPIWGKGIVQLQQQQQEKQRVVNEKNKPFARFRDDVELEEHLKGKERFVKCL